MKRILTTLSQKWPEYLLEILVITIGIYGAFELESWGDNNDRRKSELEILKGCKTELTADLKDINLNIKDLTRSLESIDIVIKALEGDASYHDSLAGHFNYTLLPLHFVHSTSTFETLKSKGLDLISNAELRSKLISLYDSKYGFFLQGESEEIDQVHYGMRHILPGRFESSYEFTGTEATFSGNMVPLDFESLKTDSEYLFFIKTQRNHTDSYINFFYKNLQKSVISMIEELALEINRIEK